MKTIYIDFLGFDSGFDKKNNWIVELLNKRFIVNVTNDSDYVFIGSFEPYNFIVETTNKITIFIPGEAIFPDLNYFDYAVGFDDFAYDDRYFRFLNLALTMQRGVSVDEIKEPFSRKFCNFIYMNPKAHPNRDKFFHLLNTYKKVDSLGEHLKNTPEIIEPRRGNWYQGSIDTKSNYKFSLSFENSIMNGYTTEKIMSSFQAKSIPIYWGNPRVSKEINPEGFINCHDFESFDHVLEKVKEIDSDKSKYLKMLNSAESIFLEPGFYQNQQDRFLDFLANIFSQDIYQAKRKPIGYWTTRHFESFQKPKKNKKSLKQFLKFK